MNWKAVPLVLAMLAPITALSAAVDGASAKFTVSQSTMIPGATLKPGTYSIRVMDHLQDRFILRVEGKGGSDHTLFIGVPSTSLASQNGAVPYSSAPGSKSALRGFVFTGSTAVEFVYPKNDAVALAKLNGNKVLAVDPTSEGKSEQISSLNKDEVQMVTLWMLTPSTVSPGSTAEPSIAAAKYQNQIASNSPHHPAMAKLPHTAGFGPLMLLIGLVTACAAGCLRMSRNLNSPAA